MGSIAKATSFRLDKNSLDNICHMPTSCGWTTELDWMVVFFKNKLRSNTANSGPIELKATKPKLSSSSFLLLTTEKPSPNAMSSGTEIGPVVTPPESKDMATKEGSQKSAKRKMIE